MNFKIFKIRLLMWLFGFKVSKRQVEMCIDSQMIKGMKKYKISLLDCNYNDYNWEQMALEEVVDFFNYVEKSKQK